MLDLLKSSVFVLSVVMHQSKFTLLFSEPKMLPPGPKRTAGRPKLERWSVC